MAIQGLGGQPADALAVHGERRRPRRRHDAVPVALQGDQLGGGDGLDFGNDEVRLLGLDHAAQRLAILHVDHMRAVRHLHRWRIGIAIHGNGFDAETLQLDRHLLAELASAEQQRSRGARRERRADLHAPSSNSRFAR